jgi:catechol 2,3-dioxygenase-like lactoylglutathione lyase family enzyme
VTAWDTGHERTVNDWETAMPKAQNGANPDLKLEVITIPVSDPERAKEFYAGLGWRLDADFELGGSRAIQFTPPGSLCSIHFGIGSPPTPAGTPPGLFLIVTDIEASRADLIARGVEVGPIFHRTPDGVADGPDPDRNSYNSLAAWSDPDGNGWLLQEIVNRLPGRIDNGITSYSSVTDLAEAMRRASVAHGEHEKRTGEADANWPDWYATYMASEQSGAEPPK